MVLSNVEEEIILLKAVHELIDSMVNFEMLDIYGSDPETNILFTTGTHQRFFNIILVDFLSRTDKKAFVRQTSYIGALKNISKAPNFNVNNSVGPLKKSTYEFSDWLEQEMEVDNIWFPTIDTETNLRLTRLAFLKLCGNISKHNFLRSIGVAEDLRNILSNNGISVSLEEAVLAMEDFYNGFHNDILGYHASTIAEFLNNIRWGIYEYLKPERERSIVWKCYDPPDYRYTYPANITSRLAQDYYWEMMNVVRNEPYVRKFEVTKWLKLRY